MARARTNPITGKRFYPIDTASPPRAMMSFTTAISAISAEALIWWAGTLGMVGAMEEAEALVAEYPMPEPDSSMAEHMADFRFQLEERMAARFGRTKDGKTLVPPHVTAKDLAADIGKVAHRHVEHSIKTELGLESPGPHTEHKAWSKLDYSGRYAVESRIDSYERWALAHDFVPLASETVVYIEGSRLSTSPDLDPVSGEPLLVNDSAGQLDVFCRFRGAHGVLDVKSGKAIYDKTWLQVEAQRLGWNSRKLGETATFAGALHLPLEGEVEVHLNSDRDTYADRKAFDNAIGLALWLFGAPETLA